MAGYNPALSIEQIRFCAEECQRQESGEMSVYRMCEAYAFVLSSPTFEWTREVIEHIAWMLNSPDVPYGYRVTPVFYKKAARTVLTPKMVDQAMTGLFGAMVDEAIEAEEMYRELETIYPFVDGNARLGAILYNRYSLSMDHPKTPPDLFFEKDAVVL